MDKVFVIHMQETNFGTEYFEQENTPPKVSLNIVRQADRKITYTEILWREYQEASEEMEHKQNDYLIWRETWKA